MEWISLTLSITNRCIRLKLDEDIMGFLQLTNYGFRREWCSLMYLTAVDPTCMRTLLAGHKRSKASTAIINLEAEYNAHRLDVLLLFAVTMSRTLALNTSTYGTISSKSKWKIEWLNSTSWKRIIKTAGHSQQALPETVRILLPRLGMKSLTPETLRDVFKKERMSKHNVFNTMAERNVPTQPPTRTDEQIVPRSQWLTIGKSNLLFNAQKIQKNPIFQISVDLLSNTNFYQAFTASANVPAIYLQQFWNTMKYNEKTGVYSCQVDEQWFDLSADLLRKALVSHPQTGPRRNTCPRA
ncbi:hypothetical protein Tco_0998502 [Tanacetum coccineum]